MGAVKINGNGVELQVGTYKGKPIEIKLGKDHIADIIENGGGGVKRTLREGAYKIPVQTILVRNGVPNAQAIKMSKEIKDAIAAFLDEVL